MKHLTISKHCKNAMQEIVTVWKSEVLETTVLFVCTTDL